MIYIALVLKHARLMLTHIHSWLFLRFYINCLMKYGFMIIYASLLMFTFSKKKQTASLDYCHCLFHFKNTSGLEKVLPSPKTPLQAVSLVSPTGTEYCRSPLLADLHLSGERQGQRQQLSNINAANILHFTHCNKLFYVKCLTGIRYL